VSIRQILGNINTSLRYILLGWVLGACIINGAAIIGEFMVLLGVFAMFLCMKEIFSKNASLYTI